LLAVTGALRLHHLPGCSQRPEAVPSVERTGVPRGRPRCLCVRRPGSVV